MDVEALVAGTVGRHPAVRSLRLVGSRARGHETALSDWDFLLEGDPGRLREELPRMVTPLAPLAAQWDRLSEEATYFMLVLPGAVKVDLVLDEPPRREPPWEVSAGTLPGIDAHFWDWILWLGGKQLAGGEQLVGGHLGGLMHEHLLGPLGVREPPRSLAAAVEAYVAARARWERELGVRVPRGLGDAVAARLRAAGVT